LIAEKESAADRRLFRGARLYPTNAFVGVLTLESRAKMPT